MFRAEAELTAGHRGRHLRDCRRPRAHPPAGACTLHPAVCYHHQSQADSQKDNGINDDDLPVKAHSELIDASGLPARRKAERVFGRGVRRDPSDLSFRPRIPPLHRHRSSSSSSEDELVARETPAARLRRLKAELEEVEAELRDGPSAGVSRPRRHVEAGEKGLEEDVPGKRRSVLPPREPVDLIGELAGLKDRLESVEVGDAPRRSGAGGTEWKERLKRLSQPVEVDQGGDTDLTLQSAGMDGKQAGLSEIDKRLATLEDLIGPSDPATDGVSFESCSTDQADAQASPLSTTINKHDHLLTLLTQPRHLDAISRRVKLLLVDLDRAAAAARRQPAGSSANPMPGDKNVTLSNADYTALQSLFAVLPRLDPLLPIIPPLLARLRSLSGLHAAAGEVADGLARLKEAERKGGEEVKDLQAVVEGVQKGLDEAGTTIKGNWEGMEKRMKDLEERVRKLDA